MLPADIDNLKPSKIDYDVKFTYRYWTIRELMKFRKRNMKITQMCWITLRPVIDSGYSVHNAKSLIMHILN